MRPIDPYDLIDKDYETFERIVREHLKWEARECESGNDHKSITQAPRKRDITQNIFLPSIVWVGPREGNDGTGEKIA